MKTKTIIIMISCILAAVFLLGVTGTMALSRESEPQSSNIDQLIGVLVSDDAIEFPDDGRLYGKLIDRTDYNDEGNSIHSKEYVFEDNDGVFCYIALIDEGDGMPYHTTTNDERAFDSRTHINVTDNGEEITYDCTVLVSEDSDMFLCFNPVYQTLQGEIYAVPDGDVLSASNASSLSVSYDDVRTVEMNGKKQSESVKISITAKTVPDPELIAVTFMDAQDNPISRQEHQPGTLPACMNVPAGTEYIIVASYTTDYEGNEVVLREVFSRGSDYLTSDCADEKGFIVRRGTELIWE